MLRVANKNYIYVLFDVDDVLNNLFETSNKILNLGELNPKQFNVKMDKDIPADIADKLINQWKKAETFRLVKAMPGIERIPGIEATGKALVGIRSNNLTMEVLEEKRVWLYKHLPTLDQSRVALLICGDDKVNEKEEDGRADIVIEDCLENVIKYGPDVVKILINKSYNQTENYGTTDKEHGIIRVNSLDEAIDRIEELIKQMEV